MSPAPNIIASVAEICEALDLDPTMVQSLYIPAKGPVMVTVFKADADGSKYVDPETGEPAVEVLKFMVRTS